MAVYSFQRQCVLYFAVKGHSFGLVSSVVNFNRLPSISRGGCAALCGPMHSFVDDYCAVDLKIGRGSGQQALVSLHEEVGFDFEYSKRKFATDESDDSNTFLGVITDTSNLRSTVKSHLGRQRRRSLACCECCARPRRLRSFPAIRPK